MSLMIHDLMICDGLSVAAGDGQVFTFGLNSHGQLGHSQGSEFISVRPTT